MHRSCIESSRKSRKHSYVLTTLEGTRLVHTNYREAFDRLKSHHITHIVLRDSLKHQHHIYYRKGELRGFSLILNTMR
jgi:hypothetical protein